MSNPTDNPILLARRLRPVEGDVEVSLAVGEGEIVALAGVARTDDALLLRCLAGADAAAEGELWLNGVAVHLLRRDARVRLSRTRCAVLLRTDRLLPELSVAENVALPLLLAGVGLVQARRRASAWLERLEVGERRDQRPTTLSPAELRRVSIARALATDPKLLFADEPLLGLDAADRRHLLRILRAAAGSHGLTIVIATRDPEVAAWAARRIFVGSLVRVAA